MPGRRPRYRFVLVEEPETLPVLYRRRRRRYSPRPPIGYGRPDPLHALVEALATLNRRGEGTDAWAPALADNPIVFLLDAMSDAVVLRRADGDLIYRNRAAQGIDGLEHENHQPQPLEEVELARRAYRRRAMTFRHDETVFTLEIFEEIHR